MNQFKNRILPISLGVITLLFVLLRVFDIVCYNNVATPSMEPNLMPGDNFFSSSWITPKQNSIVCYKAVLGPRPGLSQSGESLLVGRIAALEHDVFELKNGYVYVNDTFVEADLNLNFTYKIDVAVREKYTSILETLGKETLRELNRGVLTISDSDKHDLIPDVAIEKIDYVFKSNEYVTLPAYHQPEWTVLNYGPITIPEAHVFILGDNRNNSEDSRLRGFVPMDKIVSTMP